MTSARYGTLEYWRATAERLGYANADLRRQLDHAHDQLNAAIEELALRGVTGPMHDWALSRLTMHEHAHLRAEELDNLRAGIAQAVGLVELGGLSHESVTRAAKAANKRFLARDLMKQARANVLARLAEPRPMEQEALL